MVNVLAVAIAAAVALVLAVILGAPELVMCAFQAARRGVQR